MSTNQERLARLSPEKRRLLALRLSKRANDTRAAAAAESPDSEIPRRQNDAPPPLSFAQQRLWILDQMEPGGSTYNIPVAIRLIGPLDVMALEKSLNEIVRRHEALRTTFAVVEGRPVQIIAPLLSVPLPVVDLQEWPETEREIEAHRLATGEAQRPFDLQEGPLLRVTLIRLAEEDHQMVLTMHHSVADGWWSLGVFLREQVALYGAFSVGKPSPLPELPIQYTDFAQWQRQWLQGEVLEAQLSYWAQQLADPPPVLELPTDRPRPALQTFQGARRSLTLPPKLAGSLKALSNQEGTTLFMTLLAAFQVLLFRYTGQADISVGSPIAGRNRQEVEGLIGFFLNTLVLRTDLVGNPRFRELLARVREVALGAYAHQDLPFEQLVEQLQPERNLSHSPLFQVMFAFQNALAPTDEVPGLTLRPEFIDSGAAMFDLTLFVFPQEEGLTATLEYNTDLFDAATITRMMGHFQSLLEGVVANPEQRLSDLPLLTEAERRQLLVEWNDTKQDYLEDTCLHQLFEAQVERTPDAVAVVFEDEPLTYRELNIRANRLAHHLRALGVGSEVLVGIYVERSLEMLVGLLGVLKAGGAYVPLDPEFPQERLAFMLEDAQAPVLLTQARLVEGLPEHEAQVLCLDADNAALAQQSDENPVGADAPDNLAYVIYTSGSTGKPKGVQIPHCAANNFLQAMRQRPGLTEQDVMLAVTTLSFDIALLELFLPMCVGAQVVVVSREVASDGEQLQAKLATSGATVMQATPATWRLLLEAGWQGDDQLKVLCGGEALPQDLADQLRAERCASLWNMYGPTETTVWSAVHQVDARDGPVSIGHPIANTQVYVLDAKLQPVPIGVAGELHIGGAGLARGYLNRPELTAEKFIANPFSEDPKTRLYKTGDLARYLPDGNIECLGRLDHQVKIRGFRIELGEIEVVLAQHPAVAESVVIAREDVPGDKRLVGYLVADDQSAPSISELRRFLKQKLPEYMVPSAFVFLEALPLTPNEKVDRKALPTPDQGRPELGITLVAPRDALEVQLTKIWEQMLGHNPIGVRDNFFELGGHSLLAVQLVHQIEKVFGRTLPVMALFQAPTVEQLAEALREEDPSRDWASVVPLQPNGSKPPFFFLAGRHHVGDRLGPDQPVYRVVYQDLEREQPLVRVEDMAAHSIKSVRTIQPDGPYYLGGHGLGGIVAFEIAQQLQRQGQKVAVLTLCEAYAPGSSYALPDTSLAYRLWLRLHFHFNQIRRIGPQKQLAQILRTAKRKIREMIFHQVWKIGIKAGPLALHLRGPRAAAYEAQQQYIPKVYSGRITLFQCTGHGASWRYYDPQYGWGTLATEGVEVHQIPGSHTGIYKEPNVGVLASTLKDVLHTAQTNERMALTDPRVSTELITRDDGDDSVSRRPDKHARRTNTTRLAAKL